MEDKAKILEDNPHCPPQLEYFMVGDAEDVPFVDDDLALGREDLAKNDLEKSGFSRAARTCDESEISLIYLERDISESPVRFLILLPDMVEFDHPYLHHALLVREPCLPSANTR